MLVVCVSLSLAIKGATALNTVFTFFNQTLENCRMR